jgi:hypothetical protein
VYTRKWPCGWHAHSSKGTNGMNATRQINQAAATPEAPPTAGQTSMDMGAVALLPLPNVTRLSGLQTRGAACVWCLAQLTIETAVDNRTGLRRLASEGAP